MPRHVPMLSKTCPHCKGLGKGFTGERPDLLRLFAGGADPCASIYPSQFAILMFVMIYWAHPSLAVIVATEIRVRCWIVG
jgi:hypothetical protein